jgi:2-oxoglutarate ferredoxin oxidoreductase subunit beta
VGSTKSYAHTRENYHHVIDADFIPPLEEIKADYEEGAAMPVELHDGSKIVFRKVDSDYDPTSRAAAFSYLRDSVNAGEIITGLLYIDAETGDMHDLSGSVHEPLSKIPYSELVPGKGTLSKVMDRYR